MKLYTRTGDDGTTGLFGGGRVNKDSPRIHAIGEVDELNAALGWARAACPRGPLADTLLVVQHRLFELGADLATALPNNGSPDRPAIPRIHADHITEAELQIDGADGPNPPLRQFILPGGTEASARLHLARAVCRRAERALNALSACEPINPLTGVYLNRASDLLFALARAANRIQGADDVPWHPPRA